MLITCPCALQQTQISTIVPSANPGLTLDRKPSFNPSVSDQLLSVLEVVRQPPATLASPAHISLPTRILDATTVQVLSWRAPSCLTPSFAVLPTTSTPPALINTTPY